MHISRRQIMIAGAALAGSTALPAFAQSTLGLVRGRTMGSTAPNSISAYKKAVTAMLALDANDGRNWFRQALIHILDCPHRNWWFLPWHRGYLANFEAICRQMSGDPNFTLPYWDWTAEPSVPTVFFDQELDVGKDQFVKGYQLFRDGAKPVVDKLWSRFSQAQKDQLALRGISSADDIIAAMDRAFLGSNGARDVTRAATRLPDWVVGSTDLQIITSILGVTEFVAFASDPSDNHHMSAGQGGLEAQPHNSVHGGTGGFMGAFLSPIDPVFWLHHANLDRLWDVWARKQAAIGQPALPGGADGDSLEREAFLFFHDKTGANVSVACSDVIDIGRLGYSYESGSGEEVVTNARPPAQIAFQNFASSNINKTLRFGFETSVAIQGMSEPLNAIRKDEATNLVARVTLAPPQDTAGVNVRVYINCPYLSKFTPVGDPHFAGSISFFGATGHGGHQHGDHGSDFIATVPLGKALTALGALGKIPSSAIKVQLIAAGPGGATEADGMLKGVEIKTA